MSTEHPHFIIESPNVELASDPHALRESPVPSTDNLTPDSKQSSIDPNALQEASHHQPRRLQSDNPPVPAYGQAVNILLAKLYTPQQLEAISALRALKRYSPANSKYNASPNPQPVPTQGILDIQSKDH